MGNGPSVEEKLSLFWGQAMFSGCQATKDISAAQEMNGPKECSMLSKEEIFFDASAECAT